MKRMGILLALVLLPMVSVAQAARLKMPDFSNLASKAKESVDISLDKEMLKSAGGFMGGGGKGMDPAEFAETVKDLDGIYVRVFSFDKPGMYSMKDIEPMVAQVQSQGWKKLMSIKDGDERVEMWMRDNSADGGMFFVASEPTELVMINIVGKVNLESLRNLQGRMGVPSMQGWIGARPAAAAPAAPPAPPAPAAPPAAPAL